MTEKTHLFGEMDLDLTKTPKEIATEAVRIAELCGYFVKWRGDVIKIGDVQGYDIAKIHLEGDKIIKVERTVDDGKNWETLNLIRKTFGVNEMTLLNYKNKIKFGTDKNLPAMQGLAINHLINHYKIPVKQWGYHFDLLGIETKKQFLIWRDQGSHLVFLGLINKEPLEVVPKQ